MFTKSNSPLNVNEWVRLDVQQMKVGENHVLSVSINGHSVYGSSSTSVNLFPATYKDFSCDVGRQTSGLQVLFRKFDVYIDSGNNKYFHFYSIICPNFYSSFITVSQI